MPSRAKKIEAAAAREPDITKQVIGTLMRITLAKLREAVKARLAVDGVPWGAWYFLRALWEEDGITQRELTALVGMKQPTTASVLRMMERIGLVRIERESEDRRKLRIYLTAKAQALKQKLLPDIVALNDDVALKGFTPRESEEFRRFLLRMQENLFEVHSSVVEGGNREKRSDAPSRRARLVSPSSR